MKKLSFWLALAALTTLSLMPTGLLPVQVFSLWDKAQHAMGFGALTLLALWAYPGRWHVLPSALLVHGGLIEILQSASGWRTGDWLDLLADAVGIVLVSLVWWWRACESRNR